ncbi:MAG: DUF5320 domain-containing protein [Candidatus Bathyarchaeota archaeon]|nr:DUF5320 domain-containing protein [Candidatus Bathyarchaeota archaeon]
MRRCWRYWSRGWGGCPRHPWLPAWAQLPCYPPFYPPVDPGEELKMLEDLKKDLEFELSNITKRIEELKKILEKK